MPFDVPGLLHPGVVGVEASTRPRRAPARRRRSSCQQPGPNGVGVVVSLMHSPSGMSPGLLVGLRREHVGLAVDQPAGDRRAPGSPSRATACSSAPRGRSGGRCRSGCRSRSRRRRSCSASTRCRCASVAYCPAGEVAGQTVNPGEPSTSRFSTSVTLIAPGARRAAPSRRRRPAAALKLRPEQVVLVGRDVDAVGVGADVRVVLEARARRRAVVACSRGSGVPSVPSFWAGTW